MSQPDYIPLADLSAEEQDAVLRDEHPIYQAWRSDQIHGLWCSRKEMGVIKGIPPTDANAMSRAEIIRGDESDESDIEAQDDDATIEWTYDTDGEETDEENLID